MSDTSVRGSVIYRNKLWDALSRQPRSWSRTARVNRLYRTSLVSSATPVADHAGTQRNGQAAEQYLIQDIPAVSPTPDLGYSRDFSSRFDTGEKLGSGGNAVVLVVRDKRTRKSFACKSIQKRLEDPKLSESKISGHVASIKREIQVLKKLRGSLNVACLEEVYEDNSSVHLILDYCKGGELVHAIGTRHYSERTVRVRAALSDRRF